MEVGADALARAKAATNDVIIAAKDDSKEAALRISTLEAKLDVAEKALAQSSHQLWQQRSMNVILNTPNKPETGLGESMPSVNMNASDGVLQQRLKFTAVPVSEANVAGSKSKAVCARPSMSDMLKGSPVFRKLIPLMSVSPPPMMKESPAASPLRSATKRSANTKRSPLTGITSNDLRRRLTPSKNRLKASPAARSPAPCARPSSMSDMLKGSPLFRKLNKNRIHAASDDSASDCISEPDWI